MGIFLNPDNAAFKKAYHSEIYVDKSLLIEYTNQVIQTNDGNICVSRPRRFGKSTDANMLVAYYSKGAQSENLFNSLKISQRECYREHLNQHNVIHLDMQKFLSSTHNADKMIERINRMVIRDLSRIYPDDCHDELLSDVLNEIYAYKHEQFIFIVDEWDCIFREHRQDKRAQQKYLDYLRLLFKEQPYVELIYMTGILPIKKYGTHSALNMFNEISMLSPKRLAPFMGFTEEEVIELCEEYDMNFEDVQTWYDGYHLSMIDKETKDEKNYAIYSPRSVTAAISNHGFENYWNSTETYESLKIYIDMNFDGLRDAVIYLLAGEHIHINTEKFQNDMTTFASKDDVLTLLIHLGYLSFDKEKKEVYIPNKEVTSTFINSIENSDWQETTKALINSRDLLEATWELKEEKVASYIEEAHLHTSILQYNDENALSFTLLLAYYTARDDYTIIREMPSGNGYADLVFIPKKARPAMIVELKWNKEVKTAINQIKEKKYMHGLEHYLNNLLLVGISYDKKTKQHECIIEKYQ